MDDLAKWGWAIALLFNLLLGWAVWSLRNGFVPRNEFQLLTTKVALIENDLKHLPTQDDFAELREGMSKLQAQGDTGAKALDRLAQSVSRIEDYLLKAKTA